MIRQPTESRTENLVNSGAPKKKHKTVYSRTWCCPMCHLSCKTRTSVQTRGVRQFSCLIALLMLTAAQLRCRGMFLPLSTITPHFQTSLFFFSAIHFFIRYPSPFSHFLQFGCQHKVLPGHFHTVLDNKGEWWISTQPTS